jgi:Ca2+-binding RTX toxin-like protein
MKRRNKSTALDYQNLEDRQVLAANPLVSFTDGQITIEGTDLDDTVRVMSDSGVVTVTAQAAGEVAESYKFDSSEVDSLYFEGGTGDDLFVNRTSISSTAYGNGGNDWLLGGHGDDVLKGGPGNDDLRGYSGDDSLHGDYGNDRLYGAAGNDRLLGWYGDDVLVAGAGNDYVSGYKGNDYLFGNLGDDIVKGHEGDDLLVGGPGQDELYGWKGNDRAFGGDGDDYVSGYHGDDILVGQEGDDVIKGHEGRDRIFGGGGDDNLYGWLGEDVLNGGQGADELWGGDDNDILVGWAGNDILHGDRGDDVIFGGDGDDVVIGFYGNDRLVGGAGADMLCGGFGDDTYVGVEDTDVGYDPDGDFTSTPGVDEDNIIQEDTWHQYKEALEDMQEIADEVAATVDLEPEDDVDPDVDNNDSQDLIFVNDRLGNLSSFNTETGEYNWIGNTGATLTDIAMSSSGELFGISFNTLFKIDATDARMVKVGSLGRGDMNALTFTNDGQLLAAGFAGKGIYSVNMDTGQMSLMGAFGARSAGDLSMHDGQILVSTNYGDLRAMDFSEGRLSDQYEVVAKVDRLTYGLASQEGQLYSAIGTELFHLQDDGPTLMVDLADNGMSTLYGMTEGALKTL